MALGLTVAEGEVRLALPAGILVGNIVEVYGAAQPIIAGEAFHAGAPRRDRRNSRRVHRPRRRLVI
jgi:hypothetical protein